jgi:hypothetical protein
MLNLGSSHRSAEGVERCPILAHPPGEELAVGAREGVPAGQPGGQPDGEPGAAGVYIEIFSWADADSPRIAHQTPEVMAVWEPMGAICEDMDFPAFEQIDLVTGGE